MSQRFTILAVILAANVALAQDCQPSSGGGTPPREEPSRHDSQVDPHPKSPADTDRPVRSFGEAAVDPWGPMGGTGVVEDVAPGSWEDWGLPVEEKPALSPKQEAVKDLGCIVPVDIGEHKKDPEDEELVPKSKWKRRKIGGIRPGQTFGTGGLETCIGVIVWDGTWIYVTHISPDDDAEGMLDDMLKGVGKGATAVVAGGNDDEASVEQLEEVIDELRDRNIDVAGYANCSGIHVTTDENGNPYYVRYKDNEMKSGK